MKRFAYLLYGAVAYLIFFCTFCYAFGFVGNYFVPKSIDGTPQVPLLTALAVNGSLLLLFALQHSIMARPAFKKWWTRKIPEPLERSTYVLASSVCLIALMAGWQPMGGVVWEVTDAVWQGVLTSLFIAGWMLVLVSTFLINHFDLFGLRQVWMYYRGMPYDPLQFRIPFLYRFVRHPLYLGWLIGFWATPLMSVTHLVFALATTGYIITAIRFEEHDLISQFGSAYRSYRKKVPMILPLGKKNEAA